MRGALVLPHAVEEVAPRVRDEHLVVLHPVRAAEAAWWKTSALSFGVSPMAGFIIVISSGRSGAPTSSRIPIEPELAGP